MAQVLHVNAEKVWTRYRILKRMKLFDVLEMIMVRHIWDKHCCLLCLYKHSAVAGGLCSMTSVFPVTASNTF